MLLCIRSGWLQVIAYVLAFSLFVSTCVAAPVNQTEFIEWCDNLVADSPFLKKRDYIAKHLAARDKVDRQTASPIYHNHPTACKY